jgi:cytoskeletal protein RodZ
VRHRSRWQARRSAFLTVLAVIILAMLMISLLIFAARCATGQLGGEEFDDTTPAVPGVSVTDQMQDTTTAPPETSAPKAMTSSVSSELTSETPETAASPALDTISVSTIPIVTARTCCKISGRMMCISSLFEKSGFLLSI